MNKNQAETSIGFEKINADISEMDGKYLTFFTDDQIFGIPIAHVVQIVGMQKITEMPEFPNYAKGIINLRGSIIPVIDIRLRLGKPERSYDERTCIIVTQINESDIGFIVDSVDSVTDIDEENIAQPPKVTSGYSNAYVTGIAKYNQSVVLLIDIEKILSNEVTKDIINSI